MLETRRSPCETEERSGSRLVKGPCWALLRIGMVPFDPPEADLSEGVLSTFSAPEASKGLRGWYLNKFPLSFLTTILIRPPIEDTSPCETISPSHPQRARSTYDRVTNIEDPFTGVRGEPGHRVGVLSRAQARKVAEAAMPQRLNEARTARGSTHSILR